MKIIVEKLVVKRRNRMIFNGLDAEFEGPGLYQVIGPNGAGKTTLLLTILGFIKPESGRINIEVEGGRTLVVSYMPQQYQIPRDAPITTIEFIESYYELLNRKHGIQTSKQSSQRRIEEVLELVGVPRSLWSEKLSRLSGGTLQRVFLARAIVADPQILLLDEPFSNVDPEGKVDLADLLGTLAKSKLLVVTSHDPILLLEHTKKILILGHGYYSFGSPEEILKYDILSKFYKKCAVEIEKHVHIIDWH